MAILLEASGLEEWYTHSGISFNWYTFQLLKSFQPTTKPYD